LTSSIPQAQAARRAELAAFLRARRTRLAPADVGLPEGSASGRRRTPGLRREEVAQLSGVGVTWYTWLEQGRDISVSVQVIDALARALLLTSDQHRHLRELAGLPAPEPPASPTLAPQVTVPVRSKDRRLVVALAAGGLLSAPETSGELESWGVPGPGRYITVLANAGHTYMYVDGILYDTAGRSGVYASRWQVTGVDNSGYVVRHWPGL